MAECFGLILFLVIGGAIGWIADLIIPGKMPYGWVGGIVAALIGGIIGGMLMQFGPWVALPFQMTYYIIPGLIGTIILAFIVRFVMGMQGGRARM